MVEQAIQWVTGHGYSALVVLLMLGIVGVPIPDEFLLSYAGVLVARGELQFWPTIGSAFFGCCCGITVSYVLGRTAGTALIRKYAQIVHGSADRTDEVRAWFHRMGKWALVFGYFLPGVRYVMAVIAGTSKLQYHFFAPLAYGGAVLFSSTYIALGFWFGEEWAKTSGAMHDVLLAFSGILAATFFFYLVAKRIKRNRRNAV
jgi:membrane protein DedA with SNARE-associated domain